MALKPCRECNAQISTSAKTCPHCGKKNPTGMKMGCWSAGFICLGFFFFYGIVVQTCNGTKPGNTASTPVPRQMTDDEKYEQILSKVSATMKWNKASFGNIMEADITIKNDSDYNIKDVKIKCTGYSNSGTEIDSNTRIIYELFPKKETRTFKNFNMGFIHSQVQVERIQVVACTVLR